MNVSLIPLSHLPFPRLASRCWWYSIVTRPLKREIFWDLPLTLFSTCHSTCVPNMMLCLSQTEQSTYDSVRCILHWISTFNGIAVWNVCIDWWNSALNDTWRPVSIASLQLVYSTNNGLLLLLLWCHNERPARFKLSEWVDCYNVSFLCILTVWSSMLFVAHNWCVGLRRIKYI